VREFIRADEKRKAEERLETLLLGGLQSAETELTPADWRAIRQEAIAQVKASTTSALMPRVFKRSDA
jgi:antitoxin ParD1/3/4